MELSGIWKSRFRKRKCSFQTENSCPLGYSRTQYFQFTTRNIFLFSQNSTNPVLHVDLFITQIISIKKSTEHWLFWHSKDQNALRFLIKHTQNSHFSDITSKIQTNSLIPKPFRKISRIYRLRWLPQGGQSSSTSFVW